MTISQKFNDELNTIGITTTQAVLIGGGFFLSLVMPIVFPRASSLAIGGMSFPFGLIGIGLMAFGAAWFAVDRINKPKSHFASIYPLPVPVLPSRLPSYI